jgi:carbon monoxide dehydrogenase subunit G
MQNPFRVLITSLIILLLNSVAVLAQAPRVALVEPNFEFGKVVVGGLVEHTYVVRNPGDAPLRMKNVSMTPPLRPVKLQATIAPGEEAQLTFALDTTKVSGLFEGRIELTTDDPKTPEIEMRFTGEVVASVEVTPRPVLVLVASKGHSAEADLELVNHESDPVAIVDLEYPRDRLDLRTETLEKGRRYRLHFTLRSSATSGRQENFVVVHTTSKQTPEARIASFTYVRDRVYTFPDAVDLGVLSLREIRANAQFLDQNAQKLMVYQVDGKQFSVSVTTDVPGLAVKSEPGPNGDRVQITAKLGPDAAQLRKIDGNIYIKTNDKEFPNLVIPVRGQLVP